MFGKQKLDPLFWVYILTSKFVEFYYMTFFLYSYLRYVDLVTFYIYR